MHSSGHSLSCQRSNIQYHLDTHGELITSKRILECFSHMLGLIYMTRRWTPGRKNHHMTRAAVSFSFSLAHHRVCSILYSSNHWSLARWTCAFKSLWSSSLSSCVWNSNSRFLSESYGTVNHAVGNEHPRVRLRRQQRIRRPRLRNGAFLRQMRRSRRNCVVSCAFGASSRWRCPHRLRL